MNIHCKRCRKFNTGYGICHDYGIWHKFLPEEKWNYTQYKWCDGNVKHKWYDIRKYFKPKCWRCGT